MHLDLQSVEKVSFNTFAWAFAAKIVGNRFSSPKNDSELSPSIQSCFPLFQGHSYRKPPSVSTFSIQLSQIRLQSPIASKKHIPFLLSNWGLWPNLTQLDRKKSFRLGVVTIFDQLDRKKQSIRLEIVTVVDPVGSKECFWWFHETESLEKREIAWDGCWRKSRLILRRERPIPNIFGAKAHANAEVIFNGLQIWRHKNMA